MNNNEIDTRLAQATCAVLRDGQVAGTAWLVGDEGHLLSAGHVLGTDKPCDEVEVRFAEDIPRKAYKIHLIHVASQDLSGQNSATSSHYKPIIESSNDICYE